MKKNTKKLIALFTGASLATMLVACSPANQSEPKETIIENTEEVKKETIIEDTEEVKEETVKETEQNTEEVIDKDKTFNERYFEELKRNLSEAKEYAEDKWNSEEVVEKRERANTKLREIVDFIFNGKEINGVTFSELKKEEKEKIMMHLLELDEYIDDYIPEYKERFKNWISEKGATFKDWVVDKSADAKELWENYKSEVEEEYKSRQR